MTFLELCQRLRQEAGISGSGPVSVLGQTGEMKRVVDWISTAYEDIQNMHNSWRFLRADFSFPTINNVQDYTPAAVNLPEFAEWMRDDLRIYQTSVADETYLSYVPWAAFRQNYLFGSQRTETSRPTIVSVRPNTALSLWQVPNGAYTVSGEYFKTADIMTANASVPVIPARFQLIIVWKALMYYGAYAAADEKYAHGNNEFKTMKSRLELDQLDRATYGAPLA